MSPRAARIRLGRIAGGVSAVLLGGAVLVGGATWVEGGAPREALLVWLRLLGAMLVLGGTLGAARARARGEVSALAAMGGGLLPWGIAGVLVGAAWGAGAAALGEGCAVAGDGWRWVIPVDGGPGGWWLDGQPLAGHAAAVSSACLRAALAGGVRGALSCALGTYVGLHARATGRALALAAAGAMAVTLAG